MNELKDKEEQYNEYLNYKRNKTQNDKISNLISVVGLTLIGLICFFVFYNVFWGQSVVNEKTISALPFGEKLIRKEKKGFNIPVFSKRQNLLILGVDSNGNNADKFKGTRSDTILLLNIDPATHSINAISIPRDSKVYLADGKDAQKINHAHALGGIELTKKTVEDVFGVKIDRYIVISTDGVRKLVDTIGGIPVYVEKPLNYDDYSGKLHIHLDKGLHVLNGAEVEGFLRFRHDGLGDIGRTSRQQWFLKSLLDTMQKPSVIPQIPEALKIAMTYIKTDMTLYELSHFAALMRDINMDSVEVATLPGQPSSKGIISYWILDPEKTQEVIDRLIYRVKPENVEKLSVGIMHSAKKEAAAMEIKERLEEFGYDVNCTGRGKLPHSQIIAHKQVVSSDIISKLKRKIPEIRNMQFVYNPNRQYCTQSDFTIILSE